jgi:hypothetical protein
LGSGERVDLDLADGQDEWEAALSCKPAELCGGTGYQVERGSAVLRDFNGKPLIQAWICVEARNAQSAIWISLNLEEVQTACLFGADQTCNQEEDESALLGHCLPSGACVCDPGRKQNTATGRCYQ